MGEAVLGTLALGTPSPISTSHQRLGKRKRLIMNCKPGDLAVIVSTGGVKGVDYLIGRIIRVTHLIPRENRPAVWGYERPYFFIISPLGQYPIEGVLDDILRPLRDNLGEDETFLWAGKPTVTVGEKS